MKNSRHYSKLDEVCLQVDKVLKSLLGAPTHSGRTYPAQAIPENSLPEDQLRHSAALMRINHAGEVCAQALYQGQGMVSRSSSVKQKMEQAALEEGDHLAWCSQRIMELGSHTSYLNPLWYFGSLSIGLAAGLIGDRWSLGFLAETEAQVVKHLENQLDLLPPDDLKSQAILQQMHRDEAQHRTDAIAAGAAELPQLIKKIMHWTSKMMVKTAYWI